MTDYLTILNYGMMNKMPRPANPVTRSRLLLAGSDLVHARGYNGCGVQDITAAAGVPKGSFYNYFHSKDALAVEILDAYWHSIEERHGPLLSNKSLKPLVRVRGFFRGLVQDHRERHFRGGCLIGNLSVELSASATARRKLKSVLAAWERLLAKCLGEAQVLGELDKRTNVTELAAMLVEAYEGSVMRGKVDQDWQACDRFVERVLPRLLA